MYETSGSLKAPISSGGWWYYLLHSDSRGRIVLLLCAGVTCNQRNSSSSSPQDHAKLHPTPYCNRLQHVTPVPFADNHTPLSVNQVLCAICHPFSAHMFERLDAPDGLTMTLEFCATFFDTCSGELGLAADYCEVHTGGGEADQYWSYPLILDGERGPYCSGQLCVFAVFCVSWCSRTFKKHLLQFCFRRQIVPCSIFESASPDDG